MLSVRVDLLYSPHCMAGTLFGIIDVLRITNRLWHLHNPRQKGQPFYWRLIDARNHEIPMPDWLGDFSCEPPPTDIAMKHSALVLPGLDMKNVPHLSQLLKSCREEIKLIAEHHAAGGVLCACYNGTVMLAEAGVLKERQAALTWMIIGWFRGSYPDIKLKMDVPVVVDGPFITTGAPASYADLSIELARYFLGDEFSQILKNGLLYDRKRYKQSLGNLSGSSIKTPDSVVFKAKQWLERHVDDPYSLDDVAHAASVSKTTLLRHFRDISAMTPLEYLQGLRIEKAKQLLEVTAVSLGSIAEQCGYQDASAFRRLFRRETGMTLSEYRKKYSVRESRLRWRANE